MRKLVLAIAITFFSLNSFAGIVMSEDDIPVKKWERGDGCPIDFDEE